jgi:hypothetical protein
MFYVQGLLYLFSSSRCFVIVPVPVVAAAVRALLE